MDNKRQIGTQKEDLAVAFLIEQGMQILTRNFYFHGGELDIIAKDGAYFCFIEVKYRKGTSFGEPEEAVTIAKQKRIRQGAQVYLYKNRLSQETPCRFDVITIKNEKVTWMKDAFGW